MSIGGVTVVSGFPNQNITHKPKRMQSQIADELASVKTADTVNVNLSGVPQSVTLESAIKYYLENANGANANLYKRTASWLRELMEAQQLLKKANSSTSKSEVQIGG